EASKANDELRTEKSIRNKVAEKWPLIITNIKLRNENKDGKAIGNYTTSFSFSDVRYISWYVTLQNSFEGIKPLSGKLGVKYIRPDGTFDQGSSVPKGFSQMKDIYLVGSNEETAGRGNESGGSYVIGTHRIEFWWEGKKVGETSFFVGF